MVIGLVIILLITVAVVVVKVTIIDAKPDLNVSTFRPLAQQVWPAVLGWTTFYATLTKLKCLYRCSPTTSTQMWATFLATDMCLVR